MPIYVTNCRPSTPEERRREWWINFWTVVGPAIFVGALLLHAVAKEKQSPAPKTESRKAAYEEPKWETWKDAKGPPVGGLGKHPLSGN